MDLMEALVKRALPERRAIQAPLENKEIRARHQTPARPARLEILVRQARRRRFRDLLE